MGAAITIAENGAQGTYLRATGVTYLRDGVERRQRAKAVAVAGYSIETRLLMLSATDAHSVLPTQGSANPALTIMALAARAADRMVEHAAGSSA